MLGVQLTGRGCSRAGHTSLPPTQQRPHPLFKQGFGAQVLGCCTVRTTPPLLPPHAPVHPCKRPPGHACPSLAPVQGPHRAQLLQVVEHLEGAAHLRLTQGCHALVQSCLRPMTCHPHFRNGSRGTVRRGSRRGERDGEGDKQCGGGHHRGGLTARWRAETQPPKALQGVLPWTSAAIEGPEPFK